MSTTKPSPAEGMTLIEHLVELRRRLIISVLAVAAGMAVVTVFYDALFDWMLQPYCEVSDECSLLQISPLEGFSVRIKVTGYAGVAVAMPVLLWQVWRFVSPGLYANEKRYAIPFVATALLLFASGAGLAYWTLPRALDFLGTIGGENLTQMYSPGNYFQLVTYMMVAFGIGFEFPILLVFLQLAGILETDTLRRGRRYAIVLITIAVAVITPSGDPYSLLALAAPMVVFYELSIVIGRVLDKRRAAQDPLG
ncbi:MAG: twin-arginine translocase subunit TatC [Acidimicrobiia bacterium]